jgi:hypothetical protein
MRTALTATAVTASFFTAETFVQMRFDSDNAVLSGILGGHTIIANPPEMTLTAGPAGVQNIAAGQTVVYPGSGTFSDNDSVVIDLYAAGLGGYLSTPGQLGLSCSAFAGITSQIFGGNVELTQRTDAGCGASIAYTFRPNPPVQVPEPGSLALVGLALAAAGVAARRKA